MVKVEGKMYLIAGFDDGVVCLLEMQRLEGRSFKRATYQKSHNGDNDDQPQSLYENNYDQWHEQSYEHPDSIISVEATAAAAENEPVHVLSASKDGTIYVWRI